MLPSGEEAERESEERTSRQIFKVDLFNKMRQFGLGVNVHYIPVHQQPYYQQLGYGVNNYVESEKLYEESITLPLFPEMTDKEVDYVINTVKQIIETYKK